MAVTSGAISSMKVNQGFEFATFWIEEEGTGTPELFILWDLPSAPFDDFYHRIWLSMLRDAIAHSLPVAVGHDDDSAIVTELAILRPSP